MPAAPCTAYVDESFRRSTDGTGYFLLAAVLVPDERHAAVIAQLREDVASGQRRWHFRDERHTSRRKFLSAIAELQAINVSALTYYCQTPSQRKTEQARVRCLWNLLPALWDHQVNALVIERREERNDRKDRREIAAAQRDGAADPQLAYSHGRPKEQPLLWLPDAVVGAIGRNIADNRDELADLLPDSMRRTEPIDP